MAPRNSANAPALSTLLKPSTGLKPTARGRDGGENPLAGFVAQSLNNPLCLPIPLPLPDGRKVDAKTVTQWLRRDVGDQELQLSVQYQDGKGNALPATRVKGEDGKTITTYPDGIKELHFVAKPGKKSRAYTAADIRAWHEANTGQKITGKVPATVRDAFKAAHKNGSATVPTTA
jgi:hypothetical protein